MVRQLDRLPADATHLAVSAGGNNALDHSSLILHEPAGSFGGCYDLVCRETGLSDHLPTGEGLLVFCDLAEAVAGVEEIDGHYARHHAHQHGHTD